MRIENGTVASHNPMGPYYRVLTLNLPELANSALPGQFVHLRITSLHDAVLRRPFSIYKVEEKHLSILYKSVGRGTVTMQALKEGDSVSIVGPLGNGFPLTLQPGTTPVLIGGGYGVAPLYFLARRMTRRGLLFVGGAKAVDILLAEDFKALGWDVRIATDDGSLGDKGLVTAPLDAWLKAGMGSVLPEFYACGPNGMLKAVGDRAIKGNQKAWLSLDRHMGCGVGACLACVQKVRLSGQETLARVCKDGPIFESREVIWDD
ncbi:MAG: dihydroorotate dehydrogenase electron transfer subunit [bacterium]|jgi:dihydroorotate dehydrogenase electron transfer subunit